jgi:hypothetical protein
MSQGFLRCVSAVVVAACVVGFGCDSMNKDKDAQKRERRAARQEQRAREREQASRGDSPDQVIGRRDTARDRTTAGGAGRSRGLDEVPTTATRVDEGDAARLTYSPTRDGTLYVYDADDDRVILSTRVRRDERFVLDTDANRATIDGRTVLGTGLSARHRYRLYFDRGTGA